MQTQEQFYLCPYCGEQVSLIIDPELSGEAFIEDCEVCCRPIEFYFESAGSDLSLSVQRTD